LEQNETEPQQPLYFWLNTSGTDGAYYVLYARLPI